MQTPKLTLLSTYVVCKKFKFYATLEQAIYIYNYNYGTNLTEKDLEKILILM